MIIGNKLSEQKGEREKRQPCSCANGLLVTKTKRKWKLKWLLGGLERGGVLRGVWLWLLALWFVMFLVVNALLGLSASRCYDGGVPLGVAEAGAGRAVWHHAQVFSATGGAAGHVDGASPVKWQETAGETGGLGSGLVTVSTAPRERAQILAVAVGAPAPTARAQVGASPVVRHGSDHIWQISRTTTQLSVTNFMGEEGSGFHWCRLVWGWRWVGWLKKKEIQTKIRKNERNITRVNEGQ